MKSNQAKHVEIEFVEAFAQPSKINAGEQVDFHINLTANKADKIILSVRATDGLLNFDGEETLQKEVPVEAGTQEIILTASVDFAQPAEYENNEMQVNTLNVASPPQAFKFTLEVESSARRAA